jgi:cytochrome c5
MNIPLASACLFIVPLSFLAGQSRQTMEPVQRAAPRGVTSAQADPGERIFSANCSRCHTAPMSLAPRITGTVIMHMRARARLSQHDEQQLLKYLAP